jgi:hypothetical protein
MVQVNESQSNLTNQNLTKPNELKISFKFKNMQLTDQRTF